MCLLLLLRVKNCLQKQLGLKIFDLLRCYGHFLNADTPYISEDAKYSKLLPHYEHFTKSFLFKRFMKV